MTDPVIQNQGQTQQTTNSEIDFNLNIPTNEEIIAKEEPTVSIDFSNLEPESTQPENNVIANDNESIKPQSEITTNEPESTQPENNVIANDNESTQLENNIIANDNESIKPQPEDNRLEKEDALIEENKQILEETPNIENKQIPEIKSESLNIFEESTNIDANENQTIQLESKGEETIQSEPITDNKATQPENNVIANDNETIKPQPESTTQTQSTEIEIESQPLENNIITDKNGTVQQQLPSSNLQQDQIIIQQIQASVGKQSEPQNNVIQTAPTKTEINLDDLLSGPSSQTTPEANGLNQTLNIQNTTQSTLSPIPAFTGIQGYQLSAASQQPTQQTKSSINKKLLINFGIGIAVFLVGGFLFKTMYPIEYQKIIGSKENQTIESELTNNLLESGANENISGETNDLSNGLFENPALTNYHSSADELSGEAGDFNAFEDLENNIAEDMSTIKEQLQNYIDQGKKYLVIGKKTDDKDITKYSLFLYKKASTLLVDIENGNEISTDEINIQLADFETYLQKLTETESNEEIILQQPENPTPEEFFGSGNNGTIQENTETQEVTEITDENLSGDEDSIY